MPASAAERGGGVRLLKIAFDPPGNDTGSATSLRAETVTIINRGSGPVSMAGWTLRDRDQHVFRFQAFTLAAGAKVVVHTGSGNNTARHLYWDSDGYVWNNDGDAATLRRGNGSRVDACSYLGSGSAANC
jgi:hypothetical protein